MGDEYTSGGPSSGNDGPVPSFYVNVDGLTGLYNQLLHAAEDAEGARTYIETFAQLDMEGDNGVEGLIFDVMDVHDDAYDRMHEAADKMWQLLSAAATAVNNTQVYYSGVDLDHAAEFDALLPQSGPYKSDELRSLLTPPTTYDSTAPPRDLFSDIDRVSGVLLPPAEPEAVTAMQMDLLTGDAFSPTAWVRKTVCDLTGWDPFAKVVVWLTGDWDAYTMVAEVWDRLSTACTIIAENVFSAAVDIDEVWNGAAAQDLHDAFTSILSLVIDNAVLAACAAGAGAVTSETGVGAVFGGTATLFLAQEIAKLLMEVTSVYGVGKTIFSGIRGIVLTVDIGNIDSLTMPDSLAPAN